MFSIRKIRILSIVVVFHSLLILILANSIDISFASDIHNQLTNNSESENNKIMKSNNRFSNEDVCLRYENITKTIIVCNGTVDIPTIYDFINSIEMVLYFILNWIL